MSPRRVGGEGPAPCETLQRSRGEDEAAALQLLSRGGGEGYAYTCQVPTTDRLCFPCQFQFFPTPGTAERRPVSRSWQKTCAVPVSGRITLYPAAEPRSRSQNIRGLAHSFRNHSLSPGPRDGTCQQRAYRQVAVDGVGPWHTLVARVS